MKTIALIALAALAGTAHAQPEMDMWCLTAIGQAIQCEMPEAPQILRTCSRLVRIYGRMTPERAGQWISTVKEVQSQHMSTCPTARSAVSRKRSMLVVARAKRRDSS